MILNVERATHRHLMLVDWPSQGILISKVIIHWQSFLAKGLVTETVLFHRSLCAVLALATFGNVTQLETILLLCFVAKGNWDK